MAEALAQTGRMARADSVYNQSREIAKAMRRESVFGFERVAQPFAQPGMDTAAQQLLLPADTGRDSSRN